MYKLIKDKISNQHYAIKRLSDNGIIPMTNGNRDYEEYLAWVAEGNTPEEAE